MTEYSVGDRVLVPGVVTAGLRDGVNVRLGSGEIVHLNVGDLRPDTGGRDLTAGDVIAALQRFRGAGPAEKIAEYLNRIARGDAGSAQALSSSAGDEPVEALRRVVQTLDGADQEHDYVCADVDTDVIRASIVNHDGTTTELRTAVRELETSWMQHRAALDRLRSEVAALRAAGNALADALVELPRKATTWSSQEADAVDAWRSAAGGEA